MLSALENERRRVISYSLFDKSDEEIKKGVKESNPFFIKPNKAFEGGPRAALVDRNPLSSADSLKRAKDAQDPDQPEPFSLFDLKGNSKAKAAKFEAAKASPVAAPATTTA